MAGFLKTHTLIYCPDVFKRDKELLEQIPCIIDLGDCYSYLESFVWYHPRYKIQMVQDKWGLTRELKKDLDKFVVDGKESRWTDEDFKQLIWELPRHAIDNKYDILYRFQGINPHLDDFDIIRNTVKMAMGNYVDRYEESTKGNEIQRADKTKWTDSGYSASKTSNYEEMQRLLWNLYDADPNKFSYEEFDSYCWWTRTKLGNEQAANRRERDLKALRHYVETGERKFFHR